MKYGPNYLYCDAMDDCAICGKHLKGVSAIGIYIVANRGGIHYPICDPCMKIAKKGLPPDLLRTMDQKMERRAVELGLVQTQ